MEGLALLRRRDFLSLDIEVCEKVRDKIYRTYLSTGCKLALFYYILKQFYGRLCGRDLVTHIYSQVKVEMSGSHILLPLICPSRCQVD